MPCSRAPAGVLLLLGLCISFISDGFAASEGRGDAFIGWKEKEGPFFVITTTFGKIRLRPRADLSPKTVELVSGVAHKDKQQQKQLHFYRHEPIPDDWGKDGYWGPPYSLLQGSLADMAEQPPFEGAPVVKKGDVCIIPNSKEFFIVTADHDEWGHAHSVWAQVAGEESWATIDAIPVKPFTTITDKYNITTRWLTPETHVPFQLTLE